MQWFSWRPWKPELQGLWNEPQHDIAHRLPQNPFLASLIQNPSRGWQQRNFGLVGELYQLGALFEALEALVFIAPSFSFCIFYVPRWVGLSKTLNKVVSPKQLQITLFVIPNNFCFNNIAKKSFPGAPFGQVPNLGLLGAWTWPRWSCTSRSNLKYLLSKSRITLVSTTLPKKSHSLGLPLVRSQTLQSEAAGPHSDGHGRPETT